MLDPGEMIHWISILQETTVDDISGTSAVWAPFLSMWAKIDPVRGTDVLKAGQDTAQSFMTIKIRWQPGILANMRVQTLDGTFIIQGKPEDPGNRHVILVLNCIGLGVNQ
jgi:SPP1 family predicted phage head-tail adaptor